MSDGKAMRVTTEDYLYIFACATILAVVLSLFWFGLALLCGLGLARAFGALLVSGAPMWFVAAYYLRCAIRRDAAAMIAEIARERAK